MLLTSLALAACAALPQDPDPERQHELAEGVRCAVLAHWRSERSGNGLAAQLVEFVDATWLQSCLWLGLDPDGWEGSLAVQLYARPRDLARVRASMELTAAGREEAFATPGGLEVHVCVRPLMSDRALEELGLPPWVLRAGAEAALGRAFELAQAPGPAWLLDGLAQLASQNLLAATGRAVAPEEQPSRAAALDGLRALRGTTSWGRLVAGAVDHDPEVTRLARLLVADAITRAQDLGSLLRRPDADEALELSLVQVGQALDARLARASPAWRVAQAGLCRDGGGWLQVALGRESARAWSPGRAGVQEYSLSGRVGFFAPAQRREGRSPGLAQANLLLGKLGENYLMVSLQPSGQVDVFHRDSLLDTFERIAGGSATLPAGGGPLEFDVRVRGGDLSVALYGQEAVRISVLGRDMSGEWGIGAQAAQGLARWSDLKFGE